MNDLQGKPSSWLLKNSKGYPDFLFTILTYSMLLLIFVSLVWIAFGLLTFIHAESYKAEVLIKVMDSMKTGLISLAGIVFGLAGSYTVRRFKKDDHFVERQKIEQQEILSAAAGPRTVEGLSLVESEEDI